MSEMNPGDHVQARGATPLACAASRARDPAYLEWVRSLPCCVCGRKPCDPHHQPERGHGAMGLKASDYRAIPLCNGPEGHHTGRGTPWLPGSVHTKGRRWLESHLGDVDKYVESLVAIYCAGGVR